MAKNNPTVGNKGHFPNDQAATKLIWLALRNISENWKNPPISWHAAKAQLAIQFSERFVLSELILEQHEISDTPAPAA